MPADGEIIIDVDVDSDKLNDKLKAILEKISSKKVALQIETKDLKYLKLQLEELDNQIKSLENPGDELIKSFEDTRDAVEKSIQKVLVLKESIKSLQKQFRTEFNLNLKNKNIDIVPNLNKNIDPKPIIDSMSKIASSIKNIFSIILGDLFAPIYPALYKLDDKIISIFSPIKDKIASSLSPLPNIFNQYIGHPISNISNKVKSKITDMFAPVKEQLLSRLSPVFNKLNNAKNFFNSIFGQIRNTLNKTTPEFKNIGNEILNLSGVFKNSSNSIKNSLQQSDNSFGNFTNNIKRSFQPLSSFSSMVTNAFNKIKFNALSASHHVDYFGRRIFNLLRNAFVFNVISKHFRGLSALLGNLINRDTIFVRTLMLVKANLVRAFAPIWQVILPFIRLLGEGLLWLSKIFIKFINFLTGSNIKPVETFKEAKRVVGDFYKIASPKKEMFDLEKPQKATKKLKDNSNKISKNNKNLNKELNKTNKISNKLLASFDKLETLKFDKNKLAKDPFGLEELKKPKSNDQKLNLDVNIPSVEDQISDAINNIQDKPLDFMVNDNIGDQITSEVNGLTLPTLNFKVDENAQSWVDNLRTKLMEFYVWIQPLIESIGNFILSLGDSFKRLYEKLEEDGTFKMIAGWFDDWKNSLTDLFNTISNNPEAMDNLRNWIVAIGVAFITYKVISSISSLVIGITKIISLLTGNPLGWLVLAMGAFTLLSLKSNNLKENLEGLKIAFEQSWEGAKHLVNKIVEKVKNLTKNPIFQTVKGWLEDISGILLSLFILIDSNQTTLDIVADAIIAIGTAFVTYQIITNVTNLLGLIGSIGSAIIAGLTSPAGWVALLVGALALIVIHWDKIKDAAIIVFDKIKDAAKGFWDWISEHIFEPVKKFFGWLGENTIGKLFSGGPGFKFSGNFNSDMMPPIPKLAQGSVLKGGDPFLSWVNDQPRGQTNVEAPLNTIVSAFKQALSESEFNNQPEININASGDMSEIIRLLNFKLQDERIRAGNAFIENIN